MHADRNLFLEQRESRHRAALQRRRTAAVLGKRATELDGRGQPLQVLAIAIDGIHARVAQLAILVEIIDGEHQPLRAHPVHPAHIGVAGADDRFRAPRRQVDDCQFDPPVGRQLAHGHVTAIGRDHGAGNRGAFEELLDGNGGGAVGCPRRTGHGQQRGQRAMDSQQNKTVWFHQLRRSCKVGNFTAYGAAIVGDR